MPGEVLDIIHNLSYEANTAGINKALSAIDKEIEAIDREAVSIQKLEAIRANTDKGNLTRLNQINQAIDNRKKKIDQLTITISKEIQANDKLRNVLQTQVGAMTMVINKQGQLAQSTNAATGAMINIGRVAQDLPFGFLGIANNLNPLLESFQRLRAETGSNTAAFTALKGSLMGAGGVGLALSVVSSLLSIYALSSQGAAEETRDFSKEVDQATESLGEFLTKLNQTAQGPTLFSSPLSKQLERELELLKAKGDAEDAVFNREQQIRQSEIDGLNKQSAAFQQLQSINKNQSPSDFRGSIAAALPFASAKDIEDIIKQVDKGATLSSIAIEKQTAIREKVQDLETESEAETIRFQRESEERRKKNAEESYKNALKAVEDQAEINMLNDQALQLLQAQLQSQLEVRLLIRESRAEQGVFVSEEVRKAEDAEYEQDKTRLERLIKIRQLTLQATEELNKATVADQFGRTGEAAKFKLKAQELDISASEAKLTIGEVIAPIQTNRATFDKPDISGSRRSKSEIESLVTPDKDRTKKRLDEVVQVYKSFEQSIGDILNDISDRQIRALDREVAVRSERVRQAEKLAERGNTEILRLESERLEKAEKLRETAAQRQIAINAALALSSAIVAVATTAAESGVASIGTIPAVLAAIVAGYAFVRSLDTNTGFAEGGYTGDGGKYDAAGIVHKGEFVVTKEKTAKFRPLLEAIHEGNMVPITKEFGSEKNAELYGLKSELRAVKEAIENIHYSSKNVIDENGVYQIQETSLKKQRIRYS